MKIKTHKGIAKRIKITKTKKFLHVKAGKRHLLVKKGNNLDKFPAGKLIKDADYKTIKNLLPYSS